MATGNPGRARQVAHHQVEHSPSAVCAQTVDLCTLPVLVVLRCPCPFARRSALCWGTTTTTNNCFMSAKTTAPALAPWQLGAPTMGQAQAMTTPRSLVRCTRPCSVAERKASAQPGVAGAWHAGVLHPVWVTRQQGRAPQKQHTHVGASGNDGSTEAQPCQELVHPNVSRTYPGCCGRVQLHPCPTWAARRQMVRRLSGCLLTTETDS
jgi:hypothetical protein